VTIGEIIRELSKYPNNVEAIIYDNQLGEFIKIDKIERDGPMLIIYVGDDD